jgi:uncharacterized protein YbjT (DUF2867 family)
MKLTIFGSTGETGRLVTHQALAKGHEVVAYARKPAKLGIWITGSKSFKVS